MNAQSDLKGICLIGASAGGLEPVADLIGQIPAGVDIAIVVAQHLSPDYESRMVTLLERHTTLPISELTDGKLLQPNQIYLLAPGQLATIEGDKVVVEARPRSSRSGYINRPIDLLFNSVVSWGPKAATIVLSGTGDDGTAGITQVRDAGGLTLAQDDTAQFADMPAAAQETGAIDAIGGPAELASHVVRYFNEGQRPTNADRFGAVEVAILSHLETATGVNFEDYKRGTVRRRMEHRMRALGLNSLEALAARVSTSRAEAEALTHDILIGVTSFFRNPEAFDHLARHALPDLFEAARATGEPVRCWSAGCATGQEAYTLAMTLVEARDQIDPSVALKVFATDVHDGSLTVAREGLYTEAELEGINPERLAHFFRAEAGGWRIRPDVRGLVAFSNHNILTDAPFTRIDLMLCRNTMIYFTKRAQRSALWAFSFALRQGGMIMLGERESLGAAAPDFDRVDGSLGLYRKERDGSASGLRRVHRGPEEVLSPPVRVRQPAPATSLPAPGQLAQSNVAKAVARAHESIYEAEAIGAIVFDEHRRLVQILGQAVDWLEFARGAPPADATRLIRDVSLRTAIVTAIQELGQTDRTSVRSVSVDAGSGAGHVLYDIGAAVVELPNTKFHVVHGRPTRRLTQDNELGQPDEDQSQVDELRRELAATRSLLETAIQHQEASQQELLAANEELMVSNEELQTSIEELSSTNEELRTVADENEVRLRDVLALGSDLEQVLGSTEIGILLLNEDGSIRRFSEACTHFFHLVASDVGRPLNHIRSQFDATGLADAVQHAATARSSARLQVETEGPSRRKLLLNVLPYRLVGNENGVSVTVIDISTENATTG